MLGKVVGGWLAVTASATLIAIVWSGSDPLSDRVTLLLKVAVVIALASAGGFLFTYLLAHRWSRRARTLEEFAAALPTASIELPDEGPRELRDLSRAMKQMAGQVRAIVERARIEASRRETVLAGMAEGVLAVDQELNVVFCNDAFSQAFNTRTPVNEGRPLYEVVREPHLREMLQDVVMTGTARKDQFRSPTAAGRWFEAHALPLGERPGSGAIAVMHDVTDILRQEELRKDFVANVSHELRTPLAAIRGYAETLLDGALDDSENNRKFVEVILAHTVRLNNIASDLLVLSELDSNASAGMPDRVSVLAALDSAMHTVEPGAASRGIRLVRQDCQDCAIVGFRFRLEQALVNLLDNAVKFNKADGQVSVSCTPTDDRRIMITVSDTGIGIPSEDLKRVFERFYRVDKARSRQAGGTGLGLPIVKDIVEKFGGSVAVESQLGKGTRFTIYLRAA